MTTGGAGGVEPAHAAHVAALVEHHDGRLELLAWQPDREAEQQAAATIARTAANASCSGRGALAGHFTQLFNRGLIGELKGYLSQTRLQIATELIQRSKNTGAKVFDDSAPPLQRDPLTPTAGG